MKEAIRSFWSPKLSLNDRNKVKSIAKEFLNLDEYQYKMEEGCSDKVAKIIQKIVKNRDNMHSFKNGTVFMINF